MNALLISISAKLKNTLSLHIESLSISARVDQPVLELRREVTSFPKSQILQVVVGNWVIHRIAVNSVYIPDTFLNQVPEWAIYKKNSAGGHGGVLPQVYAFTRPELSKAKYYFNKE